MSARRRESRCRHTLAGAVWRGALLVCACASAQFGPGAPAAWAQERARRFDVPPQNLPSALLEFARQANVNLVLPVTPLDGVRSAPLLGVFSPDEALRRLLAGTGYTGRLSEGVIQLRVPDARHAPVRPSAQQMQMTAPHVQLEEDIVVVGTSLAGVYPRAFPIDVYTREEIDRTGAHRVDQFLGVLTQNLGTRTMLGPSAMAAVNREGINGVDLRGLGVGTSLVLLNGRRLPLASEGQTADVSFIPAIALERMEVLVDGASAIYGSDAIGGVVNFVLRRGDGEAETRVEYGGAADGGLRDGGVAFRWGRRIGVGRVFAAAEARGASALARSDRDYAAAAGPGDLIPAESRLNFVGGADAALTPRLNLGVVLLAGQREVKSEFETHIFTSNRTESENLFIDAAANYEIGKHLDASFGLTYGRHRNDVRVLQHFGGEMIAADLDTDYQSFETSARLAGRLFDLPGGPVRFSIGAGRMEENFWAKQTGNDLGRETNYVFGEVLAPLVGEENAMPLMRRLELTLAARRTEFSDRSDVPVLGDFGRQASPKLGLFWGVSDWLGVRASYSSSFRAPSLTELDPSRAVNQVIEAHVGGAPSIVLGVFGPAEINPESADTRTIGVDVDSPGGSRFRLRATYFQIDYIDRVAVGDPTFGVAAFSNPDAYRDILYRGASAAEIESLLRSTRTIYNGTSIDLTDPRAGAAALAATPNFVVFDDRLRNLAEVKLDGVDMDIVYGVETPFGDLRAAARLTRLFDYTERISANAPTLNVAGTVLRPPHLRARASVSLERERFEASLSVNYVDSYSNPYGEGAVPVPSWTTWDVWAALHLLAHTGRRVSLNLLVQNVFDEPPPFVASSGLQGPALRAPIGFDPTAADPLGRYAAVRLSVQW